MAMTRRSFRGYGKGFGDMMPPGTLNCPGDPGCPGYVDPSVNEAILNALAQQQQANAPTFSAPSSSWTQIAQNYSMAIYAGAAVLLLLALVGGRK